MNREKVRIGDIFNIEKGVLQSSKCIPGDYTFITAAEEWKTNNFYSHDCEALIFAAAASGSLGRTHYIKGKFISSDLCFILTPKDELKYPLDLKFYHFVFNNLKEALVKATKTGTSKEAINLTNFHNYQLQYFDIEQQHKWVEKLIHVDSTKDQLLKELEQQQTFLQLLRQTILQEAVQGKLTKQDPTDEPATELLKCIRAEKEKLIKAGKLKKEKELPPITEDEIPFELPAGWIWCRFKDIAIIRSNLVDPTSYKDAIQVAPDAIEKGTGRLLEIRTVGEAEVKSWNHYFYPNQIIYSKIRPNLSKAIIVDFEGLCSADMYPIEPLIDIQYLHYFILSQTFLKQVVKTDNRIKMPKINQEELNEVLISLPPMAEQQRIVTKVQQLQRQLSQLETKVQQSRQYAQQLLQTVLQEAFRSKDKVYAINDDLSYAAEN